MDRSTKCFILLVAPCFEFHCTESHGMYLQLHSFMSCIAYQLEASSHYEAVGNWSSRQCYLLLLLFLLLVLLSPPQVDRIWGIWGSYYNIPKAIFYLLKGDYTTTCTIIIISILTIMDGLPRSLCWPCWDA